MQMEMPSMNPTHMPIQVAFFLDRFPWNNMKYIMDSESKQVGGGGQENVT